MMCILITDLQRNLVKPDWMNWKMLRLSMIFDVETYPRLPDHSFSSQYIKSFDAKKNCKSKSVHCSVHNGSQILPITCPILGYFFARNEKPAVAS